MQQLLPDPSLVWDLGLRSPRLVDGEINRGALQRLRDLPVAEVRAECGARREVVGKRILKLN